MEWVKVTEPIEYSSKENMVPGYNDIFFVIYLFMRNKYHANM